MSKSDTFEGLLLDLIFLNANIANFGDATGIRGSTVAGSYYFAMHTADPGEAGSAITNETAYTSYARVAAARSSAGFVRTGNSISPAADLNFPEVTASPGAPLTHFSIVNTASGAGTILYSGTLTPNITMAVGVIPRIKSTSTITED